MSVMHIPIPNNPYQHRQFCTVLGDVYLKHTGKDVSNGVAIDLLEIIHDGKLVKAGLDKDTQKLGDKETYFHNLYDFNTTYDVEINEDIFLVYDDAGLNYAHFYFDLFGKLLYFDELIKSNPNLKIGIAEEFYTSTGKNNHIKQWLELYYKDLNVVVFEKNKTYKIKQIVLPNCFYWFPEGAGHEPIVERIKQTVANIEPIQVNTNGCYISRQDTLKYGWYHKRDLVNEIDLINKIKSELKYDIIELMDYDVKGKIQIFKSYKNIIQQNSASNINITFSNESNNNIILTNPRMGPWMNSKLAQFSGQTGSNLLVIDDVGQYLTEELDPNQGDRGNYPWQLTDIDGLILALKQIDDGSIWSSQ